MLIYPVLKTSLHWNGFTFTKNFVSYWVMQFIFGNFRRDCYVLKLFFYKVIKMKIFHFSHFWVRKINESKNLYLKILRLTAQRTHSGSKVKKLGKYIFFPLWSYRTFDPVLCTKKCISPHPIIQAAPNFIPPYYPSFSKFYSTLLSKHAIQNTKPIWIKI